MERTEKKTYAIRIQDLTEEYVEQCAALHRLCFPEKLESLLGGVCIEDCLRQRYIAPHGDCFCRIAVAEGTGRLAGYCYAEPVRGENQWANVFLNKPIMMRHYLRRVWFSPRLWGYTLRRVYQRFATPNWNEGPTIKTRRDWEVAKMLAIHPDFRGGNVGIDLMLDNEEQARARGVRRICGLIERRNIKAERLYQSIGWVRTTDSGDRFQVFAMHKDLIANPPAP